MVQRIRRRAGEAASSSKGRQAQDPLPDSAGPSATGGGATSRRQEQLNRAIELLHFAFRTMIAGPDRLLARRGLGRMHHRILYFVARSPGASVGELTRTLGVSKQALNAPLRQLMDESLVAWARSADDQRVKRLSLTAGGRRLERRLSTLQRALFEHAFAAVGPDVEHAWRRTMQAFGEREMRAAGRWVDENRSERLSDPIPTRGRRTGGSTGSRPPVATPPPNRARRAPR